jgi:hypothetical protein
MPTVWCYPSFTGRRIWLSDTYSPLEHPGSDGLPGHRHRFGSLYPNQDSPEAIYVFGMVHEFPAFEHVCFKLHRDGQDKNTPIAENVPDFDSRLEALGKYFEQFFWPQSVSPQCQRTILFGSFDCPIPLHLESCS